MDSVSQILKMDIQNMQDILHDICDNRIVLVILCSFGVLVILGPVSFFLLWNSLSFMAFIETFFFRNYNTRDNPSWDKYKQNVGTLTRVAARIWHGYEVVGLHKVPPQGGALMILYHCALPFDFIYSYDYFYNRNKSICYVGDRFLFSFPPWKKASYILGVFDGNYDDVVERLKQGRLVVIAPGGVREAQFSDNNYQLLWGKRTGFAKAAIEAKVPIIPVFTRNGREAFRTLNIRKDWLRRLHESTRMPVVPIYGGFPVKLTTFIGDPIEFDPNISPEKLVFKVKSKLDELIKENQRLPGSIVMGLLDRITNF